MAKPSASGKVAGNVDVLRALGVVSRGLHAEEVGERVVVLHRRRAPRAADVRLEVLRLEVRVVFAGARVVVVDGADIEAESAIERCLPAAVEVHLDRRAVVQRRRNVRVPVAEIEARRMRIVDSTLDRRLIVGLRKAAEPVVAGDREVAAERVVRRCCRRCRLGRGQQRSRTGSGDGRCDECFLHEVLPFEGSKVEQGSGRVTQHVCQLLRRQKRLELVRNE